jgi:recombinational DNA repair protein (RecF pathway)
VAQGVSTEFQLQYHKKKGVYPDLSRTYIKKTAVLRASSVVKHFPKADEKVFNIINYLSANENLKTAMGCQYSPGGLLKFKCQLLARMGSNCNLANCCGSRSFSNHFGTVLTVPSIV